MTVCLLSWQWDIWGYGFESIFKKSKKKKIRRTCFLFCQDNYSLSNSSFSVNYGSTFLTKRDCLKTLWKQFPLNEKKICGVMGKYLLISHKHGISKPDLKILFCLYSSDWPQPITRTHTHRHYICYICCPNMLYIPHLGRSPGFRVRIILSIWMFYVWMS